MKYKVEMDGDYVEEKLFVQVLDKLLEDTNSYVHATNSEDDLRYYKKLRKAIKRVRGYVTI